jgi:hypothetical protein
MSQNQHQHQSKTYKGACFCGAVEIAVTGDPVAMGYCHCDSCRRWSASPVNGFTLWQPDSVRVTKGADQIGVFNRTDNSFRKWCKSCGGHLMNQHPKWGLIDVYAAVIPEFPFRAGVHVNYQETVLPIHDGLPKQKDVPAEIGGSNTLIAA